MILRRHVLLPLVALAASPAFARPTAAETAAPASAAPLPSHYDDALGIALDGWPYPAPVRFFSFVIEGQAVRMAYMDVAPASGPSHPHPVVLLHGKNFDSSYWAGPMNDLVRAGYRVIVPDQIGFNKSSKPEINYSFDALAQATLGLLDSLDIPNAIILGHSTGGMLAVRLAAAYPARVVKLILEDPIGLIDYRRFIPPQPLERLMANEQQQTVTSYRAFIRHFFPLLPAPQMEPFVEWRLRVALSGEYERFCKAAALTYQMIYREPVRDEYQDIQAPVLMFAGTADESAPLKAYASPEMAAKMPSIPQAAPDAVRDIKKARLILVDKAGHVPHLETPDLFRAGLLGFLAG